MLTDDVGVDEIGVDEVCVGESGVDVVGVDEVGVGESGVDEGGVDETGVDEGGSLTKMEVDERVVNQSDLEKSFYGERLQYGPDEKRESLYCGS